MSTDRIDKVAVIKDAAPGGALQADTHDDTSCKVASTNVTTTAGARNIGVLSDTSDIADTTMLTSARVLGSTTDIASDAANKVTHQAGDRELDFFDVDLIVAPSYPDTPVAANHKRAGPTGLVSFAEHTPGGSSTLTVDATVKLHLNLIYVDGCIFCTSKDIHRMPCHEEGSSRIALHKVDGACAEIVFDSVAAATDFYSKLQALLRKRF